MNTAAPIGTFYAFVSADQNSSGSGYIVRFDTVGYDAGGEYSPGTGIFLAPVSGTYVFHVNVVASGEFMVELVVTTTVKMTARSLYGDLSGSVVVHANAGQEVFVRIPLGYGSIRNIYGAGYTHFAGFLLHADPIQHEHLYNWI